MPVHRELDVVSARRRVRTIAGIIGFDERDQARIAAAVSEIARNAVRHARDGSVEFEIEGEQPPFVLIIRIADHGPGMDDLDAVLDGRYRSNRGVRGFGIAGAQRLMDQFDIASAPSGTVVLMKKLLDIHAPPLTPASVERLRTAIAEHDASGPIEELQQQQRELLVALADARERQEQLAELNRELEDTNRGVVALYAELDEKADHLRRADEMKSRFLSNMSHEFRTPLNSIRALAGLLLDRVDGPLSGEQERQVALIRKATDDLSNLVEDLLDLARIEAGKLEIHPAELIVENLFSALRGMLRPLLPGDAVVLRFAAPTDIPALWTDEAKVSQILRNFISNALKYTERGFVEVRAWLDADEATATFCVEDTGIGIAHEDLERIFEEFVQVRGPMQKRVKGTGLGLPLCRRLAHALRGEVRVESTLGEGSRFFLTIPARYAEETLAALPPAEPASTGNWRMPVLVVEDDPETQRFYESALAATAYRVVAASTLHQASAALARERPAAIIVDVLLEGGDAWRWLAEHKGNVDLRAVPVLVISSAAEDRKALALGADAFIRKPVEQAHLLQRLNGATRSRVLVIEDDETTRYAVRKLLHAADFLVLEAANGEDGLQAAAIARPRAILLDLGLPDVDGFAMLDRLRASPETREIPVVLATARDLTDAERRTLEARAFAVLSKRELLGTIVPTIEAALRRADLVPSVP
jgi:signal transduction histidine kinase/DNA-binding response OmpR family regulator